MQQDLDELRSEAMLVEDKAHRAMMEAAKLAEDLRMEQDNTQRYEADRKMLEAQVKDLQVKNSIIIQLGSSALSVCRDVLMMLR